MTNSNLRSDAFVLAELAAVLRAIARRRRGAGRLLREMANAYEARAHADALPAQPAT